jgi:predicted membrane protein
MTMTADTRPLVPPRLVLGMVTVIVGLMFLADSAGMLRADSALALWPVGLLALGLVVVLQPDAANRLVGAVLIIAGVWLLLDNIGVWSYGFWRTWPYLLILFGAWMLYRLRQMRKRGAGIVTGFAFLNRVIRQPTAAGFAGGEFSAVGGECDIDLTEMTIDTGQTVIDVFSLFGRIDLCLPAGWSVDNRVLPLLGRSSNPPPAADGFGASERTGPAGPTVIVQGSAICGSVSVTSPR